MLSTEQASMGAELENCSAMCTARVLALLPIRSGLVRADADPVSVLRGHATTTGRLARPCMPAGGAAAGAAFNAVNRQVKGVSDRP
jgi:hypothetical protein